MYINYATPQDVADYLGKELSDLPTDLNRLISRSSELITQAMMNNYVPTIASHVEASKLATCAQIEFWLQEGEDRGIANSVSSYSLDSLSVTYGNSGSDGTGGICKRSKGYLGRVGLLYRGIGGGAL